MKKHHNSQSLIGVGKAILDEGITISPKLSMRQVRLICYALEDLGNNLGDGELLYSLHEELGNKGPVSEAGCQKEIHELLRGIGPIVYGPDYYRS